MHGSMYAVVLLSAGLALPLPLQASAPYQENPNGHPQESSSSNSEVPELVSFHEVIHRIWHEAWPNRDVATLKKLQPDVEEGISMVAGAELPDVFGSRKDAWKEGVEQLLAAGSAYKAACDGDDAAALLDAAEELHSRFENLMQLVGPELPELDDFHSSLRMLVHSHLPDYDIEQIRASAVELKRKIQALNMAAVPRRLRSSDQFQAAREKLSQSVETLGSVVGTKQKEAITRAVEEVHNDYRAIRAICD